MSWDIEVSAGTAAAFHARPFPEPVRRTCWVFQVNRAAVALGSAQPAGHLGVVPAEVEVVRRRSGGGAVWLAPGDVLWVDLVIPKHDPLWDDDIGRATWWVGDRWASFVAEVTGRVATVHRTGMVRTQWSSRVCFAGLGPGEVLVDGYKVVGVSQRRTREGARFQCAALVRWRPETLVDALDLTVAERADCFSTLADTAAGLADLGATADLDRLTVAAIAALTAP